MTSSHFILALPRHRPCLPGIVREPEPRPLRQGSASLWASDTMPVMPMQESALVIGRCFASGQSGIDPDRLLVASDVVASARSMLRKVWGAYVAILYDARCGVWQVMGDPSGLLPVFRCFTPTHVLLSSDPALFATVSGRRLEVRWNGMLAHLMQPDMRQRATCLRDVDELPPGVLLDPCALDGEEQVLWRPSDHFPQDPRLSFGAACEELRTVAIDVLGAWRRALGPVAVAVSGGVDSSLICGALAAGDHPFGCITLATSEASGDERHYARLLANHLGRSLKELIYDPAALNAYSFASCGLPRPSRRTFVSVVDAMLARGAAELGAAVVLDGNAGDGLFCYLYSAAPVADRLRALSPRSGAFSTLLDMCRVTGCDVPTMARETLKELRRGTGTPLPDCDLRLLAAGAREAQDSEPLVSWHEGSDGPHQGKRDHVALILRSRHNIHGISSHAPRLSPLMSQPLLETCLRIPTWLWPRGGINRALARSTFAAELPASLYSRTVKPGPDSFIRAAFEQNRTGLHALLRQGLLAGNGLLDLDALDQAFARGAKDDGRIIPRLLDLAEAENWARSWQA
jgi:asparagine synthase (glutamine-hydrolysing)